MATNLKEELTCVICHDFLNDPKVLRCLHSFCCTCLKSLFGQLRELECPLCSAKMALSSPRDVEELPSNISVVRQVEIVRLQEQANSKKSTPICQNCDVGDVATSSCSECVLFLCDFCEKAHR